MVAVLALLPVAGVLTPAGPLSTGRATASAPQSLGSVEALYAADLTARINAERSARSSGGQPVPTLQVDGGLQAAAQSWADHLAAMGTIWNYASVQGTRERLERAGFEVSDCWLAPAPTTPPRPREFLQTVIFAPYLEHLPAQLHAPFLDATLAALGEPVVLDYQRLNWDATAR